MQNNNVLKLQNTDLEIAKKVLDTEIKGLKALESCLDQNFSSVIDILFATEGRIVVTGIGKSGHIAKKFVATLSSTGSPAIFLHPAEAVHGDLGMIAKGDVVVAISNSGESSELSCIIDYCKRFEIDLISISRNPDSTLAKASDYKIVMQNIEEASCVAAPTTSTTMTLAMCDIIAVALHERRGFSKCDFKNFHPGGKLGVNLLKVSELMHTDSDVPYVKMDATFADAILEMTKKRLGCVAVINEDEKFIGMLTDGDVRRNIGKDINETKALDVMTKNPTVLRENIYAAELLKLMNAKQITNIFVLEGEKILGVVHLHDLLKAKVA